MRLTRNYQYLKPKKFKTWQQQVGKQFKKLYGISIETWQQAQIVDDTDDCEEDWATT